MGKSSLVLKDKLHNCDILPNCGPLHQGWGKTISLVLLPLSCDLSILCCVGAVLLVFRSFSEGIHPCATVDLVYLWEEVSSGSSYAAILSLLSPFHSMRFIFISVFCGLKFPLITKGHSVGRQLCSLLPQVQIKEAQCRNAC